MPSADSARIVASATSTFVTAASEERAMQIRPIKMIEMPCVSARVNACERTVQRFAIYTERDATRRGAARCEKLHRDLRLPSLPSRRSAQRYEWPDADLSKRFPRQSAAVFPRETLRNVIRLCHKIMPRPTMN